MRGNRRRQAQPHWALLAILLVAVFVMLVLAGVTSGQIGENDQAPASKQGIGHVPSAISHGGPIVDPSLPTQPGVAVRARHVVLTFDDGPTAWTPQVLDVLERHHVPATFFVIGAHVAQREGLLRRMRAAGDEVGVHTFTHVNLSNASPWRLRLELDQTELAIAAATGYTTDLMRPPYSSTVADLHASDWQAVRQAGNFRVVFADLDTKDWQRPGVARIVAAGLPAGDKGAVVMLHDGGGDRSQTVKALDRLITALQQRGYVFDTVTSAIGATTSWHQASFSEQLRGRVVLSVVRLSQGFVGFLSVSLAALAALAVARAALLLVLARRHARDFDAARPPWDALPPVSVIVPAYNEEVGIQATVRSLAASSYPELEILVVDDGSTDSTPDKVDALGLPGVRVIRQANAGKPAALNTGIAAARHDVLVMVDADTVFEPDAMQALVAPLSDPGVGAVSGNTKVGNRKGLLGRWQHIEYVIGFNLDRRMFDLLRCMPTVPGAIGAFRRQALQDVGGVSGQTLAEDTDLTMAICRSGWRVVYTPLARAWTEAPATLGQLWRQRYRWCYGTMQAMWKHRRAVIEGGASGKLGRRGLPYLLAFQVLLPLLAPFIDLAVLYSVVFAPSPTLIVVWLAFLGVQYVSAGYAFALDEERLTPLWSLVLQQFVYRQLMYVVVIQSVATALYGFRLRWQTIERTGDLEAAPTSSMV